MVLPDPDYLSIMELSRRWNCDLGRIFHYVETSKLRTIVEYRGRLEAVSQTGTAHRIAVVDSRLMIYLPASLILPKEITPTDVAFCYSLEPLGSNPEMETVNRFRQDLEANIGGWRILLQWQRPSVRISPDVNLTVPYHEVKRLEKASASQELSTRERNTLLRTIAVMAVADYDWDGKEPYKIAKVISDRASLKGYYLPDRTLGDKLKEGAEYLDSEKN